MNAMRTKLDPTVGLKLPCCLEPDLSCFAVLSSITISLNLKCSAVMASVQLTAPNGVSYSQPTGLFINNEFVPATGGETITSIDPA